MVSTNRCLHVFVVDIAHALIRLLAENTCCRWICRICRAYSYCRMDYYPFDPLYHPED